VKFHKIIFIIPALVLVLALILGSSLLWRLFLASALVLVVSYFWALFANRGIHVTTNKPPEHSQFGERFERNITVENTSRFPRLFIKVGEDTNIPGYQNEKLLNLKSGETQSWQNLLACTRRGQYSIGSVTVTSSDPFGLFMKQVMMGESSKTIVYPRIVNLPLFKSVSLNDFGYASGFQSISQISPNASSVREFTSGDSLHHIHWHTTAHTGRLMVKMFDADHSYKSSKIFWVVIDMDENAHAGHGDESTEEYAVTIAASLVRHHLESGMKVGMISAGNQSHLFSPSRGEQYLWGMMEALALVRAEGKMPLGQLILGHMEDFKEDPIIMIIATSASRQLMEAVRRLKSQVESVMVVLLDASSFNGKGGDLNSAHNLSLLGAQVYSIRQGDEISKALDSRSSVWQARYGK
jgi:uncharacterized protein (DUF58 family)